MRMRGLALVPCQGRPRLLVRVAGGAVGLKVTVELGAPPRALLNARNLDYKCRHA
jgi:hypothetical protein